MTSRSNDAIGGLHVEMDDVVRFHAMMRARDDGDEHRRGEQSAPRDKDDGVCC